MKQYHPKNQYRIINTNTGEIVGVEWATPIEVQDREIYIKETGQNLRYEVAILTPPKPVERDRTKSNHYWY